MIKDGILTYTNTDSPIFSWRIENSVVNTLLLAIFTTIIAYQGKAVFFDLLLGLRKRGRMKLSDIHVAILSTESSPLGILDGMLRNDWLTRKRLRGDIPVGTTIARDGKKISKGICAKLLFLILIGPIVNIVAVSLTLEIEQDFTIGQAGLGGLEVGINEDFSTTKLELDSVFCFQVPVNFGRSEQPLSRFYKCSAPDVDQPSGGPEQGMVSVRVFLSSDETSVHAVVWNNSTADGKLLSWAVHGEVRFNGTSYRIRANVTEDDVLTIAAVGAFKVREFCNPSGEDEVFTRIDTVYVRREIACPSGLTFDQAIDSSILMQAIITVKDAPELALVSFLDIPFEDDDAKTPFSSGFTLPLLRRTRGTASFAILAFIALGIIVLRIFVRIFAYNDFPVAIEVMVRDRFGLHCCDSFLQNDTVIEYRKKFQLVEHGHYGMRSDRQVLPEVEKFDGGAVV